jgi:hypothetical protein
VNLSQIEIRAGLADGVTGRGFTSKNNGRFDSGWEISGSKPCDSTPATRTSGKTWGALTRNGNGEASGPFGTLLNMVASGPVP